MRLLASQSVEMFFAERSLDEVASLQQEPVEASALEQAREIVEAVRRQGLSRLIEYTERFQERVAGLPLVIEPAALRSALEQLDPQRRGVLERAADNIRSFAEAQRACLRELSQAIPGGLIGHQVAPVERAGCYAPGGRFPLPSTVLMTAITARAAGVPEVWLASPRPTRETMAAAALAGVDGLLAAGGAHAVAALAFGAGPVPACDAVVGPGNQWVTAAKQLVSGRVRIDMLAGPSEVLIIADESADVGIIAADLLAQCEHDTQARGILVTPVAEQIGEVRRELRRRLKDLPTRDTAEAALENSAAVRVANLEEACEVANRVAPEHLEVLTAEPDRWVPRLQHFGALFVGQGAAEVLGDYGLGPNHTLPTGGTARAFAGLSVLNFLRVRSYVRLDAEVAPPAVFQDAAQFARMEGLEAHARSAEARLQLVSSPLDVP